MISLGLERHLLLGQSLWFDVDHLVLIFARLYASLKATNENPSVTNADQLNEEQEMTESSTILSSSDNIIIELVGEFYERIKQSYTLPYEAVLLLRPLPSLLAHYGLSDRLMNKMVVEFAAFNQHLYPQILAYTIFAVFRGLIQANHSAKVNEWSLLSMTSVAQRKPTRISNGYLGLNMFDVECVSLARHCQCIVSSLMISLSLSI